MTVVDASAFDCDCELSSSVAEVAETQGIPSGRSLHRGEEGGEGRERRIEIVRWYTWSIGLTQMVVVTSQPVPCVPLDQV